MEIVQNKCKIRFPYFGNQLPEMQTHSTEAFGASFNIRELPEHWNKPSSFLLLLKICDHLLDVHVVNLQFCAIP